VNVNPLLRERNHCLSFHCPKLQVTFITKEELEKLLLTYPHYKTIPPSGTISINTQFQLLYDDELHREYILCTKERSEFLKDLHIALSEE
jgi:hypothetical protein